MSVNKKSYNDHMQERGAYAIVPNEIWERNDLDHTAKVIWCYILSRKADWNSSRNNIARNLSMSVNTVSHYVEQLKALNILSVTNSPQGSWNFEIIAPDQWLPESNKGAESKQIQITERSTPESKSDLGLNQNLIHTQEYNTNNTILSSREASKVSSSLKKEMKIVSPAEAKGDQRKDDKIHVPSDKDIKLSPDSAVKSVAQPKLPDYAVKTSNWYQHYLKSPINEEVFKSLPTEIQSSLYAKTLQLVSGVRMSNGRISDATDAKDQFVTALEAYRQKNNPDKVTSEDDFTFEF